MFPSCDPFPLIFNLGSGISSLSVLKTINFRNIKNIQTDEFRDDLCSSLVKLDCINHSFETNIMYFNSKCASVLDSHAPLITKQICDRKSAP